MALIDTIGLAVGAIVGIVALVLGVWFGGQWFIRSLVRGRRGRRGKRIAGAAAVVLFIGAVVGLIWVLISGVSTETSAYPLLDTTTTILSSPWLYVGLGLFLLRGILIFRRKRYASQAAAITGMDQRSIRQLAAEARSPDGTTRVVATVDDTVEEIERRIVEALQTGEDDTLSLAEGSAAVEERVFQAERRAQILADELDLPDDMGSRDLEDDADPEDVDDEEMDFGTAVKHLRMDLASALNFSNIFWQFVLPAAGTTVLALSTLGVWVGAPWYPVLIALGMAVGALNYYRHRRREAKKLDSFREDVEETNWSMLSILVKPVETQETTGYYVWVAGRRYAAYDRLQFVEDVADRAHQKLHQGYPEPSVMEKNAEQLADYYPDLAGFQDQERHDIQLELIDRVRESKYGLVPKQQLTEDVVEHRLEERAGGLYREGLGYDPALVRAAYDDLVPGYLTEVELTVDTEDGPQPMTAVESTIDPLPVDRAQIRAEFSALFREYASREPRYDLPDSPDVEMPPQRLEPRSVKDIAVGQPAALRADGGEHE
jgi:hypothetical protein